MLLPDNSNVLRNICCGRKSVPRIALWLTAYSARGLNVVFLHRQSQRNGTLFLGSLKKDHGGHIAPTR